MRKGVRYGLLIIGAVVFAYPFLWMIFSTFKPDGEIGGTQLLPEIWTIQNYIHVFERIPIEKGFLNSLVVTSAVTLSVILFGSVTGYALSRLRWKGRELLFSICLLTMMIPFQLTLIPTYILIVKLGLTDSLAGLIIPTMVTALSVLLFRQSFLSIPQDLIDAARLDGCSELGILFRVVLPISKPAVITVGILTFVANWNEVLWPLIIIREQELMTMPQMVALFAVGGGSDASTGAQLASALLLALPVIIAYFLFQKRFIQSMASSGLKS
ncbi:MAG: carbohydrate ABC transporter permease [Bacteroidota bacterium]